MKSAALTIIEPAEEPEMDAPGARRSPRRRANAHLWKRWRELSFCRR